MEDTVREVVKDDMKVVLNDVMKKLFGKFEKNFLNTLLRNCVWTVVEDTVREAMKDVMIVVLNDVMKKLFGKFENFFDYIVEKLCFQCSGGYG